ncbi:MAG TPA: NAD(P)-dependent oxidoreductase [Candidatus Dormibacteraeota bacterium]|jgi:uronate dehydrogenase|nr:NAD(P)-dependent oxidoreductase [Candidatus Dormibacteraeota bacterium]
MSVEEERPVLVTGASGRAGGALRQGLAGRCRLRLLDLRPPPDPGPEEEVVANDIRDLGALTDAAKGCRAIVHLAAIPHEAEHEAMLDVNLRGTYNAMEAAVSAGCERLVFASSNHVTGYFPSDRRVDTSLPPRPDGLYAVSKVYGEALGRLYFDRDGLRVAAIRIGSLLPEASQPRHAHTWISHRDFAELVWRCLETPELGFLAVYGGSDNHNAYWDDREAWRRIGYRPQDSADAFAAPAPPDAYQGGHNVGRREWR